MTEIADVHFRYFRPGMVAGFSMWMFMEDLVWLLGNEPGFSLKSTISIKHNLFLSLYELTPGHDTCSVPVTSNVYNSGQQLAVMNSLGLDLLSFRPC